MICSSSSFARVAPLFGVLLLAGCVTFGGDKGSDNSGTADHGISVLEQKTEYEVDPSMVGYDIALPAPAVNPRWAQAGGNMAHEPGNLALSLAPVNVWNTDIGNGSSEDAKLLATPIIVGDKIYAQDASAYVSAYDLKSGDRLWRVDLAPEDAETKSMGGGLAWNNGTVYATTGYGQVVALQDSDGSILWRQDLGNPLRSAPTVSDHRVFVLSLENETYALDAKTGRRLWHHRGIAERASLLGTASPAVKGDIVVVPYSSGEVFGLRTQNGRLSWSVVLAVPRQDGALPAIADVRGLPVIADRQIYAISHSGRMVAVDQRTGVSLWEQDVGGINTPAVVGTAIYVVTNDNKLVALSRPHGKILWSTPLEILDGSDGDKETKLSWYGPVMAGGQLWVVSSVGVMAAYDPKDGGILYHQKVGDAFYLPPVVANETMLLLDDSGEMLAFR